MLPLLLGVVTYCCYKSFELICAFCFKQWIINQMELFLLAMVALPFIQHRLMLFPDPLSLTLTVVGLSEDLLEEEGHWLIRIVPLVGTKVCLVLLPP